LKYYLSNAVRAEVGILLNEIGLKLYEESISFLESVIHQWSLETSIDGKIRKPPQTIEEKGIKVEFGPKGCIVSFSGVPKIRELYWADLILHTQQLLTFPNHCFLINSQIVHGLIELLPQLPTEVLYKALLEICDPFTVQEDTFRSLQGASAVPTEDELKNLPNVVLVDSFNYEIQEVQYVRINPYQMIPLAIGGLDEHDLEVLDKI
jgi:hypothetical protein